MGNLSHLDALEAEAIYIIREVAAECEKPVMLYSIGKDSSVMLHLAMKAFYPEKPPFPFLHIDTTWKFKEMIKFRDDTAKKLGIEMLTYTNEEGVKQGINPFDHGSAYTDIMKTQALKQALNKYGFTAAFGGGRRDEEKSRAKERIFSFRNTAQAWDPKNQRPEMWKLYNTKIHKGESMRVFPISNWTEKDIWQYIQREKIDIVPLYFAAERPVVYRDGNIIMVDDDRMKLRPGEKVEMKSVRFRTLGCYPLTGGVESTANTLDEIIDGPMVGRWDIDQGDKRLVDGGVIERFMEAMTPFISQESAHVNEELRREMHWFYALEAVREALINALAHRDWTRFVEIEVSAYSNRLEIISPGTLPNSMTVEKMKAGQRSPRNTIVMEVLRDYGYVDYRGMGVRTKIVPLTKALTGKEPEFELTEDYLKTVLYR